MTIRAVFFDMGGTIETFWYTRRLRLEATPVLQDYLQSAGIDLQLSNDQLYEVVSNGLDRYHLRSIYCMDELPVHRVWRDYILHDYPVNLNALDAIAEDLMVYIENRYYSRAMRPEIPAVLDTIQKMRLKIGLISNVCSRGQVPGNLEKYSIRHYFNPIVLSSEYGRRKPDPAIFHYAARLANVPTSECIYVGDRIARDIIGAHKAGYRMAIYIHHDFDHGEPDQGDTPDAVIHQMTELLDILQAELDHAGRSHSPRRAILFDAGDILYYRQHTGRKLAKFLREVSIDPTIIDRQDNSRKKKNSLRRKAYQGLISVEQYREAILRLYGLSQPEHIERGKRILEEDDNDIIFYRGVCETLHALKKRGYLLGIITDTAQPLYVKLSWFERGGFGNVWDSVVSSQVLGIRKPNPTIYQAALQQLGVGPDQAVFVGHKSSELKGARSVGMRTIAFNYDKNAAADYYVENFSDLLQVPIISEKVK